MAQAMPGLGFFLRNVALELLELSPLKGLKMARKTWQRSKGCLQNGLENVMNHASWSLLTDLKTAEVMNICGKHDYVTKQEPRE